MLRRSSLLTLLAFTLSAAWAAKIEHVAGGGDTPPPAQAAEVQFIEPFGVAFDEAGDAYIVEFKGHRVSKLDADGRVTTFAGTGEQGYSGDGGPAAQAQLNDPHGLVIVGGAMYVADTWNNRVRQIDLETGEISTVAGTGEQGYSGDGGPATEAAFHGIFAIAADPAGEALYLADLGNRRVRRVDLETGEVTTVAGNGEKGVPEDGAVAAESPLVDPRAVAADDEGAVYVLERGGNALRVVDKSGKIRTLIGADDLTPPLKGPKHLTVDPQRRVVIADAENHLIRRYDPATGKTTNIAGTAEPEDELVTDDPLQTGLRRPHGVSFDDSGALWIVDSYNHRVLKLTE